MCTSKNLNAIILIILIALITACGARKDQNKQADIKTPEDYVEQASFVSLEGDSVHVSDFKGKVILIDFWETWCRPCIASFPGIDSLKQEYPNNFEVLAVTPGFTDSEEDARTFADNNDYNFTYLMDSNGLHKKLNVSFIPYKIYIDPEGNYIKSETGGSAGPEGDYQKIKKIIEEYSKSTAKETGTS